MLTRQGSAQFLLILENGLFFREEAFKGGKLEFLAKKTDELVIPEVAGDAFYHERRRGYEVYANLNIAGITDIVNEDEEPVGPLRIKIGFLDTGSQRTELNQSVLYQGIKKANNRDLVDTWTTKHEKYLDWASRVTIGDVPESEGEEEEAAADEPSADVLTVSQETFDNETDANNKRLEKLVSFIDKRIAAISDNDDEEEEDNEETEEVYLTLAQVIDETNPELRNEIFTGATRAMDQFMATFYMETNAPKKTVKAAKPEAAENPKQPVTAKPPGSRQVPPRGSSQPQVDQTETDLDVARGKGGRGNGAAPRETNPS